MMTPIRCSLIRFACVAALPLCAAESQAQKRAMTLDDGFRVVSVGGGQISPDGRWALYSRTARDFASDSSKGHLVARADRRVDAVAAVYRRGRREQHHVGPGLAHALLLAHRQ